MSFKLLSVKKSDKPKKKLVATFENLKTKRTKKVYFGAAGMDDYTLTKDKEQRARYRKRTINQIKNPNTTPLSPSYLSYYILWGDSTSRNTNIKDYKKRFNL